MEQPPPAAADVASYPSSATRQALVIDLPGIEAVAVGLALARHGYRPVPLFNSCLPSRDVLFRVLAAAVDARGILEALVHTAPDLAAMAIAPDAPPAFLIDSRRTAPGATITAGMFDNRAVVFAADFPSAMFLRSQGIHRACLVHDRTLHVENDLRHALRHWPAGGIPIEAIASDGQPLEVDWPRSGFIGELIERIRAFCDLQRSPAGGFGRLVAESSGG